MMNTITMNLDRRSHVVTKKKRRVIGLMSGTSVDGIDAALMETDGFDDISDELGVVSISYSPPFKILLKASAYVIRKYHGNLEQAKANFFPDDLFEYLLHEASVSPSALRDQMSTLLNDLYGANHSKQEILLNDVIQHSTDLHAHAVKKLLEETGFTSEQIDLIGYHGQTMFHYAAMDSSKSVSVIVGDGQSLADQTGIVVVNQFRGDDLFMGGQGAPFAPLFHQALAKRDGFVPAVVVNCGGISNVTIIPNDHPFDLIAFDTGAGNGLIDQFVLKSTRGHEHMDRDGQYGKRGTVDTNLLSLLYEKSIIKEDQNYFLMKPPKSLDIRDLKLIPELFEVDFCNACRTLEEFTADSIVKSVELTAKTENFPIPKRWILAGGGFHNPVIREALEERLKKRGMEACTADDAGWNAQALEAKIFAYLAVRCIINQPISFPKTTGVSQPMSGGRVFFPSIHV